MTTYVAVFAMVLAYVALVAAFCALRTLAKLRRATSVLTRGGAGEHGRESVVEATERHAAQTALLGEQVAQLRGYVEQTCAATVAQVQSSTADLSGAVRNVALVRYDAFSDVSGRLSFSLALLDDDGDGIAISAIAGRTDTRVYAKGVAGGKGEHELSPEEQQALTSALHKRRGTLLSRKAS
ncbi:MAG: hypothetical protein JWO57_4444 [Pseudonocardiales bacterium]|nr:hypothetical protein [Pseudonocardiales bacterium]